MRIITTREIRNNTKTFLELAENEKIIIKRGQKYIYLMVANNPDSQYFEKDWLKEFLAIPAEYRCDPFEISPSGDLYFADKRNVQRLNKSIEQAKQGKTRKLTKEEQAAFLGL